MVHVLVCVVVVVVDGDDGDDTLCSSNVYKPCNYSIRSPLK